MSSFDPAWLDRMYNNRALVPQHAEYFERWRQQSGKARASLRCDLDQPFAGPGGPGLDVFQASGPGRGSKGAPVMVFIHGGYWRSLDKSDHSFVAPAFTAAGACVVVPNYDLCPLVTIPQITMQMVEALVWTYRNAARYGGDRERITVVGHSAGGHLAAILLTCVWQAFSAGLPSNLVKNALSISGLYELEPLRHTPFLSDSLKLTGADARQASPAWLPPPRSRTLYSVAGADESAEFLRQNLLIQKSWGQQVVPVCEALAGLNHFSVLEALSRPGHRLHALALQLLNGS